MKPKLNINNKFSFELDHEKIKQGLRLSPKERLDWLEEANHFLQKALTPKQKKIWEKIRKGEF